MRLPFQAFSIELIEWGHTNFMTLRVRILFAPQWPRWGLYWPLNTQLRPGIDYHGVPEYRGSEFPVAHLFTT